MTSIAQNNIHIIPFEPAYQPGVDQLLDSIAAEYEESFYSPAHKKITELYDSPGRNYWLAMAGGKVVGTVGVIALPGSYSILKSMFLHREYRGGEPNIAQQLLQTAIARSVEVDCMRMYLGTMGQFKAAQRFYERQGFAGIPEKDLPADYPGNNFDTVFYVKKLRDVTGEIMYVAAGVADIGALVDNRVAFLEELTGKHDDEEVRLLKTHLEHYFAETLNAGTCICWLAKAGDKVAGTGALVVREQPGSFKNPSGKMGYIMNMYTVPEFRRRGICSAILKKLIDTGRGMGIHAFELHATKEGEPVYRRSGFEIHIEPTYRKYITMPGTASGT